MLDFKGEYGSDIRPARQGDGRKPWAKDPSSPGGGDGTRLDATAVNDLKGLLLGICSAAGVTPTPGDDTALANAIVGLIGTTPPASHNHDSRYYTESEADLLLAARVLISDIVDNLSSTDGAKPLSAGQGKVLKDLIDGLGDVMTVADLAEAAALTGLDRGDLIHVLDNGAGKWARYQVTAAGDGTWAGATKVLIWTQDQAPATHGHVIGDTAGLQTALDAKLSLAGGTLTGPLVLPGNPGAALAAVPKQYVDSVAAGAANLGTSPNRLAQHIGLLVRTDASTPLSVISVSAEQILLYGGAIGTKLYTSFSGSAAITAAGANGLDTGAEASNTWYYIWVIAKEDDTKAVLLSTSPAAPTMPADYVYKGLVGAVFNNGSSDFVAFRQNGTVVGIASIAVVSAGVATVATSVNMGGQVPPEARAAVGNIVTIHNNAGARYCFLGPENSLAIGFAQAGGNEGGSGYARVCSYRIPIITPQTAYYNVTSADSPAHIYVTGYEW